MDPHVTSHKHNRHFANTTSIGKWATMSQVMGSEVENSGIYDFLSLRMTALNFCSGVSISLVIEPSVPQITSRGLVKLSLTDNISY